MTPSIQPESGLKPVASQGYVNSLAESLVPPLPELFSYLWGSLYGGVFKQTHEGK